MNDIKINIQKGICVVHARYEGVRSTYKTFIPKNVIKGESDKDDTDEMLDQFKLMKVNTSSEIAKSKMNESVIINDENDSKEQIEFDNSILNEIIDFDNFSPDRFRILRGTGFVRKIGEHYYVITVNDIMVKHATYSGYGLDSQQKIIKFDMIIHCRIPEINIVIMKVITSDVTLQELTISNEIRPMYTAFLKNYIVTSEYIPPGTKESAKSTNTVEYKTLNINNNIALVFDIIKFKYLQQFPLLNIPVDELEPVKNIVRKLKINLKTDLNIINDRRHLICKMIAESLTGLSGSIIRSGNDNIGIIILYTDTNKGLSLKAIPLHLMDIIVKNSIEQNITNVMNLYGIQVDTQPCEIDIQREQMNAHYVLRQSCSYINGKKFFAFSEGDIIVNVDGKRFNQDKLLWSDIINLFVPLNTYMMLKSLITPIPTISIKISKHCKDDSKIRIFNLMSVPYTNMYYIRTITKIYEWRGLIFMDLSLELLEFYRRLGVQIENGFSQNDPYALTNEKIVILFNYEKSFSSNISNNLLCSMPYKNYTSSKHYFYVVNFVGQKKINNLDDLMTSLQSIKTSQKQVTFKLTDINDNIKLLVAKV